MKWCQTMVSRSPGSSDLGDSPPRALCVLECTVLMVSHLGGSLLEWNHRDMGRSSFHLMECLCFTSGKNKCPRKEKEEVLLDSESWNRFLWSTWLSSFPRLLTLGQSKAAERAWGVQVLFLDLLPQAGKHLSRLKLLLFFLIIFWWFLSVHYSSLPLFLCALILFFSAKVSFSFCLCIYCRFFLCEYYKVAI